MASPAEGGHGCAQDGLGICPERGDAGLHGDEPSRCPVQLLDDVGRVHIVRRISRESFTAVARSTTTSLAPPSMLSSGSCKRHRMRSESVISNFEASALARATSPSDMRTWICLGYRSIASAEPPSEFLQGGSADTPGARGIPRRDRSRGAAEASCRRPAPGTNVPDAVTRRGARAGAGFGARARGGRELFRVLCTRNRPLALLRNLVAPETNLQFVFYIL